MGTATETAYDQNSSTVLAGLEAARRSLGAVFCAFAPHPAAPLSITDPSWEGEARRVLARRPDATEGAVVAEVGLPSGDAAGFLVAGFADASAVDRAARSDLAVVVAFVGQLLDADRGQSAAANGYRALFEIGTQMQMSERSLDAVLALIVEKASQLLQTDCAWLGLVDDSATLVEMAVSHGIRTEAFTRMSVGVGEGLGGVALAEQQTIVVEDYAAFDDDPRSALRGTVLAEGIVSMLCAPMLRDGRMIGALYVGDRRRTHFGETPTTLLSALAVQASVAIENAQLYGRLEEKNAILEQLFSTHRELTDAGRKGAGLDGLGATLAGLLGRQIVVEQSVQLPHSRSYSPGSEEANGEGVAAYFAIVGGEERLGGVAVSGPGELSELERRTAEHGATVFALELMKIREAREVEWRLQGELLDELLRAPMPLPEATASRAGRVGMDTAVPHRLVVFSLPDDPPDSAREQLLVDVRAAVANLRASQHSASSPLIGAKGSWVVVAVPERLGSRLDDVIGAVVESTETAGERTAIGVSAPSEDFGSAFRQARACAVLAASAKRSKAIGHEDLGALGFLLDAPQLDNATAMVRRQLGPLIAHDEEGRAPLLETLRAYLDADGHQATAAATCFIHVSTLKYRISRIKELLPAPLADPSARFELKLAIQLLDVLRALGVERDGSPQTRPDRTAGAPGVGPADT